MTLNLITGINYYNRIIKHFRTIEDYESADGIYLLASFDDINFNPNDGVYTTQILNYNGVTPDYCIVTEDDEIISRWFIIETSRTRAQQYELKLFRDVVSDCYETLLDAPMFVEKGMPSYNDPAIFNNEGLTFNQIKTNETLLKDQSLVPWIIGYYDKNATDISGSIPTNNPIDLPYIEINTPIENWELYNYNSSSPFVSAGTNIKVGIKAKQADNISGMEAIIIPSNKNVTINKSNEFRNSQLILNYQVSSVAWVLQEGIENGLEAVNPAQFQTLASNYLLPSSATNIMSYNNTLIKDSTGSYYDVTVSIQGTEERKANVPSGNLFQLLNGVVSRSNVDGIALFSYNVPNSESFTVYGTSTKYVVGISKRTDLETTYDLTGDKLTTIDSPANIFAIPYGKVEVYRPFSDELLLETSEEIAIATATAIQKDHQSKIYDIQLLPYFPLQELINGGDNTLIAPDNSKMCSYITDHNDNKVGIIYHIPYAKFSINALYYSVPIGKTILDRKVNNECDYYRLASPNYSNYFDFSAEKNDGIGYFSADCEYKPFTPYIHINPNFNGLYGSDFNDTRGLILGGDFSLSQIRNEWQEYELRNKNYQNTFDRQIQNMEVNNNISRISDYANAITGTISGATTGGLGGKLIGAGAIGAGIGAGLSAIGGIADITLNEMLRTEAMDYTKDLYNYQLQNIRALPQTISKVSSFNPNNKIFPVLEFYTCTDIEKEALKNKIKYNGMTIMRIGTLGEFTTGNKDYFKGKLIRLNIEKDFHFLNALANELDKGVFI